MTTRKMPMNPRNPPNNPFLYTRDLLLNLYSDSYNLPEDTDGTLPAFVDEPRPPLAHLPLSDVEKRLLNMVSINSEGNRRNNYVKPKTHTRDAPGPIKKDNKDDMWDTPGSTVGGFGADGVFGGYTAPISERLPIDPLRSVTNKKSWTPLINDDLPSQNVLEIDYQPFAAPLNSNPVGIANKGRPRNPEINVDYGSPVFNFVPPMWVYEDPSKRIQGPFTSEQMHGWYKEGYFPPGLPIKCVGDSMFISLVQFVEKFGSESPFLDSLREQEHLEREYFMQMKRQQQTFQPPASNYLVDPMLGFSGRNNPVGSLDPGLDPSINPAMRSGFGNDLQFKFGQNNSSFGIGTSSRADQQPFLNYMAPLQFETTNYEPPLFQNSLYPNVSPPKTTPVQAFRAPSPVPPPAPEIPVEVETVATSSPEPVSEKPSKSKKKKAAKNVAPSKPEVPEEVPEPVEVEEQIAEDLAKPAVKAPVAPWASKANSTQKATLKKIQESEQKELEEREAEQAAEKLVAPEPSLVVNSQWASVGSSAAAKPKKTLAQIMEDEKRKAVEVQANTPQVSKGYASTVASNAPNQPAPVVVASKVSKSQTVVATGPVIKPTTIETEGGWNVVGKNNTAVKPIVSPPVPSPAPVTSNSRPSPVSIRYENSKPATPSPAVKQGPAIKGATQQFVSWCRTVLHSVSKESSLNIEEFLGILLSLDLRETSTIKLICDDALGGYTSIDSRKFADEFIKHRQDELAGIPWTAPIENVKPRTSATSSNADQGGWTSVGGSSARASAVSSVPAAPSILSENKFVVVGKTKKNKKKK